MKQEVPMNFLQPILEDFQYCLVFFFFSCVATVNGVTVGGITVVVLHDIIVDKMTYYFIIL